MRSLLCAVVLFAACSKEAPPNQTAFDPASLRLQIDNALELRAQGKQVEGIALLERTRLQALDAKEPAIATNALNRRGDFCNDLGRTKEAAQDYETAYAEAESRADHAAMGRAAHDRALLNSGVLGAGEPDALKWYPRAFEARRKAGDHLGMRRSANNLAIQYFYASRKEEALHWYGQAVVAGEAASDWEGVYKVHANLALLHAVAAEGAFVPGAPLRAWVPPLRLDAASEAKAREHFARSIEAAAKTGRGEEDVCGVFGNYGARCARLSPSVKPGEGLTAFFAELAMEAGSEPGELEPQLKAALLCLRAADAAREGGRGLSGQVAQLERSAREHFAAAADREGGVELLCAENALAEEACARLRRASRSGE